MSKIRTLIVDDNNHRAESLRLSLQDNALEAEVAPGAEDALKSANALAPDVIVIDVSVANGKGYALTRMLAQSEKLRDAAIVLLIANNNKQAFGVQENYGLQLGASKVLTKPLDADVLLSYIAEIRKLPPASDQRTDQHTDQRTDQHTDQRTDQRTDQPKQITAEAQPPGYDAFLETELAEQIKQRLAQYLGPIAHILVKKTADEATSLFQFCSLLAEHIENPQEKIAFLNWVKNKSTH